MSVPRAGVSAEAGARRVETRDEEEASETNTTCLDFRRARLAMVWDALSDERVKMKMSFFFRLVLDWVEIRFRRFFRMGNVSLVFSSEGYGGFFPIQSTSFHHGFRPRSAERSPRGRAAHSPHSTPRVSRVDRVVANFARARTPEGAPPNAMHATGVTAARCVAALAPRCAFSLPLRFGVTTHFLTRAMRATRRASARTRRPRRRGRLTLGAPPFFAKTQMRADGARRLPSRSRRTSPGGCVPRRVPNASGGNNTLETSD